MAERRTANRDPEVVDQPNSKLAQYRTGLAIDQEGISDEVCEHPETFEHVAEQLALAVARVDAAKYDLELTEAREAARIRDEAIAEDRKATDKAVAELVLLSDKVGTAQRKLLAAKAQVGEWSAVKEAWQQRSYMLKECVAIYLTRMNSTSSVTTPRDQLAEGIRERTGQMREERGYRRNRSPA